ncbi:MAG: hypothetical protein IH851_13090 [Armatimonadetes bacterium]|nr:hypothetical protein [Armatimonadota bacterium]
MLTSEAIRQLIYGLFEDEQQRTLPGEVLQLYAEGLVDFECDVVGRLVPGFPFNSLEIIPAGFIVYAEPEGTRFIIGSYLLAATAVEKVSTAGEPTERYTANLLGSFGADGCISRHSVIEQYSLLTIRQCCAIRDCLVYIEQNGRIHDARMAKDCISRIWNFFPSILSDQTEEKYGKLP